ncbi:MAG TPA: hypothetical protein VNT99_07645 [Methylomirabilota bacterium]|nr:hypothetical protein [Methylomirabilota bacterium]
MKTKMGRPKLPKNEAKGELFAVRVAKPDAEAIHSAIKRSGIAKPEWLRNALLKAANVT